MQSLLRRRAVGALAAAVVVDPLAHRKLSCTKAETTPSWWPRWPWPSKGGGGDQLQKSPTASRDSDLLCMNHGKLKLYAGNAHPELAKQIAEQLGVPLSSATVSRFPCGEVNVVINESVRDCDVFVVQPTCNGGAGPQEHLVELLIMLDAIRRGAANRITAVMPVYGYARQNAKDRSRSPITARLMTDLLQVAGAHRVLTIELHASQIQGFASYPIDNMFALPLLASELEMELDARGVDKEDIVVVSPDVGGTKRASTLAKLFRAPLAIFSRQRRRQSEASELDLVGEVEGKVCVIVDDIADTADTIVQAADKLKARGARAVICAVVHGVFSDPAVERINRSALELVIVTDTIPLDDKVARCPKLRVVSVAPLLAASILRIHTSESLSALFGGVPPEGERLVDKALGQAKPLTRPSV